MKNAVATSIKCLVVSMLFAFVGCGSDSNSQEPVKEKNSGNEQSEVSDNEKQDPEEEQASDEKQNSGKKTEDEKGDPNDERDYVKSKLSVTDEFSIDTVRDSYYGTHSYWIRTGNIVWSLEKVTKKTDDVESVCYDDQNGNCDDYGRLFAASAVPAHKACPDGQNLASAKDYEVLDAFRLKHGEIDERMALEYGGSCEMFKDSLVCSGIDTTGNYLTSDGKVYSIKKGDLLAKTGPAKENGYYNVRCIKYPSFVKSIKDLPACDSSLKSPPRVIYVFDEKENYHCYPEKESWLPDFTESCTEEGKTIVFDNTMMICEDGIWQYATVEKSPEKCSSENRGKILVLNGEKYACDSSKWREFTGLEDSLGLCNDRKSGAFDTLYTGSKIRLYHCDGKEWGAATIEMYKGPCEDSTSKFMNDTIDYKNMLYVCRGNGWEEYSDLEKRFGACVPSKLFMFENGSYDVDDDKTEYLCDTTGWKKFTQNDIIGSCDFTEVGDMTIYRDKHYLCEDYGGWRQTWTNSNVIRPKDSVMYSCDKPEDDGKILNGNYSSFAVCIYYSKSESHSVLFTGFSKCDKENEGVDTTYSDKPVYCNGDGYWHNVYEGLDKCTTKNYGKTSQSTKYGKVICDYIGWRHLERFEEQIGICSMKNDGAIVENQGEKYLCFKGLWKRYKDKSTYRVNGSKKEGK
jgi:uncharacterized protein (TIGR02145 family)